MALTVEQFRINFPEFSNTLTYPTSGIQFWLNFAYRMLNPGRWMNEIDMGASLFTAHFIALEARSLLESSSGGIPGMGVGGPVSSKSVDKVSISYDTGAGTEPGAGHWNLTNYGTRFIWMVNIFGTGPIQLGAGYTPPLNGPAWPGPDTMPGFTTFGN
jgi:hypothetical protein